MIGHTESSDCAWSFDIYFLTMAVLALFLSAGYQLSTFVLEGDEHGLAVIKHSNTLSLPARMFSYLREYVLTFLIVAES